VADLKPVETYVEILRAVRQKRRELDEIEAYARDHVESALGADDTGTIDGEIVVTYKPYKQRRLNQRKLKADEPGLYELYCETTESRRLTVNDSNKEQQ
jgi:predicted phage-related endonuclease